MPPGGGAAPAGGGPSGGGKRFKPRKAGVRSEAKTPQMNQGGEGAGGKKAEQQTGDKKPGKLRKQLKPTLIMLALIAGVSFTYLSVRAAREALSPPDPKAVTLPQKAGNLTLEIPHGWKGAEMQPVKGSSERWAFGSPGARDYAMFISRYPLNKIPESDGQIKKIRSEAQQSIADTGGPRKPKLQMVEQIGGEDAYRYSFKTRKVWVDLWLSIHKQGDKAALYQFSCQSKPGEAGNKMRDRCAEALDTVKFSNKLA